MALHAEEIKSKATSRAFNIQSIGQEVEGRFIRPLFFFSSPPCRFEHPHSSSPACSR